VFQLKNDFPIIEEKLLDKEEIENCKRKKAGSHLPFQYYKFENKKQRRKN